MLSFLIRVLINGTKTDLFMVERMERFDLKILCGKMVSECIRVLNKWIEDFDDFNFEIYFDLKNFRDELRLFPSNAKVLVLHLPRKIYSWQGMEKMNYGVSFQEIRFKGPRSFLN